MTNTPDQLTTGNGEQPLPAATKTSTDYSHLVIREVIQAIDALQRAALAH